MAGFSKVDSVIAAWAANHTGQRLIANLNGLGATVANNPYSLFVNNGPFPASGASGTTGKANGRVLVGGSNASPSTGAMLYQNAGTGLTNYLSGVTVTSYSGATQTVLVLVDRIADVNLSASEASGNVTGLTAVSRLEAAGSSSASGCLLWAEVTTVFSAAQNTYSLSYTNQDGVAGRTTPNFTFAASAAVANTALQNFYLWIPLQDGDAGVRSVESITLVTNNGQTGNWNLCLVRPLAFVNMARGTGVVDRDMVAESMNMEKVFDDSYLNFIVFGDASTQPRLQAEIRIVGG